MADYDDNDGDEYKDEFTLSNYLSAVKNPKKVKKTYVPDGYKDREEFIERVRKDYEDDLAADQANRDEALEDKKFTAGEHWDPRVKQEREAANLPCLVINQIPQFTAQLVGDWRQQRNAVRVLPAEDGDNDIADIRSDLVRTIEYQSRASRVYDQGFESSVQCGDGAWRVQPEYASDSVFDQDIFIRPIEDCLSVIWDRFSVDPTGKDARRVIVEDTISCEDFENRWPGYTPDKQTIKKLNSSGWTSTTDYRILEHWRMIERDRLVAMFQNGSIHIVDETNFETLVKQFGSPVKSRISPVRYAQMHVLCGWDILEGPYEYKLNRVPIIRVSGRVINIGGRRYRHGLVRFMRDPARLKDFHRSVAAEQHGYAPKSQWLATEEAVGGREEAFREAHRKRDPLLIANDEAVFGQNLQRIDPPQMQVALLQEAQLNTQDMKDVTGIHDASLGIRSNETSGKAINARKMEGDVASITFYDNGNAAILETGDVINQFINITHDATRIIRIVGEDQATKFIKINDPNDPSSPNLGLGSYDVVLTTGTSFQTRRAETAEFLQQMIQVYPQLMQIAGDLLVKTQDFAGADKLAERIRKTMPQNLLDPEERDPEAAPMPSQEQIMQMQAQLQELAQENQELKMKALDSSAKLDVDRYNAVTQRIRALSDNMVDDNAIEMDYMSHLLDRAEFEHSKESPPQSAQASQPG